MKSFSARTTGQFSERVKVRFSILVALALSLATIPLTSAPATAQHSATRVLRWAGCGISKKGFMEDLAAAYRAKTGVEVTLQGGGATRGIRDTAADRIDMGGSCRHRLPVAEEADVEMIEVGWDALVAIVHPSNPINGISLEQMKQILAGSLRNWKALGGPDQPIHLVTRSQGKGGKISGVGRMLRELAFGDPGLDFTSQATEVPSSGPLERLVETDPLAIGVTGISSARHRTVKILSLEKVKPSYENIARGAYKLVRPLYLVVPKEQGKRAPGVDDFIAFARSKEGQAVIKRAGTVNLADGAVNELIYRKAMEKAATSALRGGGVE